MFSKEISEFVQLMGALKAETLNTHIDGHESLRLENRHGDLALLSPSLNPDYAWRVTYFKSGQCMNHIECCDRVSAVKRFLDDGFFPLGTDIPELPFGDTVSEEKCDFSVRSIG